jgi:hypothetical protein
MPTTITGIITKSAEAGGATPGYYHRKTGTGRPFWIPSGYLIPLQSELSRSKLPFAGCPMEEWSKMFFSTLGGFAAGIISQPFNFYVSAVLRRNALKSELYQGLGRVYYAFVRYRSFVDDRDSSQRADVVHDPGLILEGVSSELFDDAIRADRAAVRGMPEYDGFKALYAIAARTREAINSGVFHANFVKHEREFYAAMDELTKAGILDSGRLYKEARIYRRRTASRSNKLYQR